jgi:hydrogenase-4 component F
LSTLLLLALFPLLIAAGGLGRWTTRWLPAAAAALMVLQLPVALFVCWPALHGATPPPGAQFGVDGLGAVFLLLTTLVAAAAMVQAALLLPAEGHAPLPRPAARRLGRFYTLSGLFLLAMYGVLLARNLGYLWIAMEATTLMSAPLVYYHRSRDSLEATWKYLMLCSVGIAFALFGTVLIFAASQPPAGTHEVGETGGMLMLDQLLARGAALDPRLLRLGFIFCLLGYGTKAGLFPLHNWLPDAHSEAPAPASAMLSGALLNCALVALWRISQVMAAAGQASVVRTLLVPAAAITVLAAGLMIVRQHDLKRMWAYSSVEHVGLLTLAIGIGAGPVFMLHATNHSLVKACLFLLAGNVLQRYGTKSLAKLGGLLEAAPGWALLLAGGTFAVAGSPPFGTFLSEWLLLAKTLAAREIAAAAIVLLGLTITFVAVAHHLGRLLFGSAPLSERTSGRADERRSGSAELERGRSGTSTRPLFHSSTLPLVASSVVPAALLSLSLLAGLALAPPVMAALSAWTGGAAPR